MLAAVLVLLGALAALSVILSDLPWPASLPLAIVAVAEGIRLGRKELRRPPRSLVLGGAVAILDGSPLSDLTVQWRGPMAFVRFRDGQGRWRRLAWWPDTLDERARRELRLAIPVQATAHPASSMAP